MKLRELYVAISQFHENPRLIAFAATPIGGLIVWLAATLLLIPSALSWLVPILLIMVMIKPERTEAIMGLGSIWVLHQLLITHGIWGWVTFFAGAAIILSLLYLVFAAARSFQRLPGIVRRYPLIIIHFLVLAGLVAISVFQDELGKIHPGLSRVIIAVIVVMPLFLWRIGYLFLSVRNRRAELGNLWEHLYYLLPIYGGMYVPYGKGHDYLSSKRAHGAEELAKSQLAGLKLLNLALLWSVVVEVMDIGIYGIKGNLTGYSLNDFHPVIFHLKELILGETPLHIPIYITWTNILIDLIYATLETAIVGHIIIGCLRLFGFNVFRNTYKPLLAQSILDFWNRYFYYFKEVLLEFFFYPCFLSYFKSQPKLRIFAAVMMAAFLGNVYYHLLMWMALGQVIITTGKGLSTQLVPYLFYAFLLGIGIFVSMHREGRRRGKPLQVSKYPWLVAFRRIMGVWLFFGLIRIWDVEPAATFGERMGLFRSLFGL